MCVGGVKKSAGCEQPWILVTVIVVGCAAAVVGAGLGEGAGLFVSFWEPVVLFNTVLVCHSAVGRRFNARKNTGTYRSMHYTCVVFTFNRSFYEYSSTSSTPSLRADSSSLRDRCKLCGH